MPELLGRVEDPDGVVLFLEDVQGGHHSDLTDEDLSAAAHALGTAHGTALAGGAIPQRGAPWARDSLSEWVTARLGRHEWLEDPDWDTSSASGRSPPRRCALRHDGCSPAPAASGRAGGLVPPRLLARECRHPT